MMQRGLDASRGHFARAIELDPGYGPAWAGPATANGCLAEWFDPGCISTANAEQANRRALVDDELPERALS